MMIIKFKSTDDTIKELQDLRSKIKPEFLEHISNYYDEMKHKRQTG